MICTGILTYTRLANTHVETSYMS